MGNIAMPMIESLKLSDFIINTVTGDVDDTTARRRARDTDGGSIAWIIGHLIHYRYQMLAVLGEAADDTFAKQFGSTGATDGADYPPLAELVEAWNAASALLLPVLEAAADDVLTQPLGGEDTPHGEKRVLDTLVFLLWHEPYHIGQIGALRTQFGLTPTATLATQGAAA